MTTQYLFGFVDGKILEFLLKFEQQHSKMSNQSFGIFFTRIIIENHLNTLEASLFLPKAKSADLLIFKRNF